MGKRKKPIICPDTGEEFYDYKLYLKSKHWKLKREEFFASDRFTGSCSKCQATKGRHVHHLTYKHVGNEPMEDLIALCAGCHKEVHGRMAPKKKEKTTKSPSKVAKVIKKTLTVEEAIKETKLSNKTGKCYVCSQQQNLRLFGVHSCKIRAFCPHCLIAIKDLAQRHPRSPLHHLREKLLKIYKAIRKENRR